MREKSFFSRLFGGGTEAQHGDEKNAVEPTPIQTDKPFLPFATQEIRDQKAEQYQWSHYELALAMMEYAENVLGNPAINPTMAEAFRKACDFAELILDHKNLEKAKRENHTTSLFKIYMTL